MAATSENNLLDIGIGRNLSREQRSLTSTSLDRNDGCTVDGDAGHFRSNQIRLSQIYGHEVGLLFILYLLKIDVRIAK